MKISTLFAAMYQTDFSLPATSNCKSASIVVNQTNFDSHPNLYKMTNDMKFVSSEERGLSKSRNCALELAEAEICVIADDDVVYPNDALDIINNAYITYPDADVILFDMGELGSPDNRVRKSIRKGAGRVGPIRILRANSIRTTFRLSSIRSKGIRYNENFGAGSNKFMGFEDVIFLSDCIKHGLKVYYVPKTVVFTNSDSSSWFSGYNKNYFRSLGAFSSYYLGAFWPLYVLQYIVRHNVRKDGISFVDIWKCAREGHKEYTSLGAKWKSNR